MELSGFISNCRHRKNVVNKRGKAVSCVCGHCVDCYNRKANKNRHLCDLESSRWKYVYFFTLTYDEYNVPRMRLEETPEGFINCYEYTTRPYKNTSKTGKWKKYSDYNKLLAVIPTNFKDEKFKSFYSKATPKGEGIFRPFPYLRYIRNKDAQDFIKRVRFYASRDFDISPRYFISSEYGPETFSPHFHGLLYFDSDDFAKHVGEVLRKAWKFGAVRKDSFAERRESVGTYCAGYINSFSCLPYYLSFDSVRPKSFHSVYFGTQDNKDVRDYLYKNVERAFFETSFITSDNRIIDFIPTSGFSARFFPRCYNYEFQSAGNIYRLYTCYLSLKRSTGLTKCSDLARYVILYHDSPDIIGLAKWSYINEFLKSLEIYRCYVRNSTELLITSESFFSLFDDEPPEETIKLYNRIYSAINFSRNFLIFNCEKISVDEALTLINFYYRVSSRYYFANMYNFMNEYNLDTGSVDYSSFYYNSKEYYGKHCNLIFSHFLNYDTYNPYESDGYIRKINRFKDVLYQKKIKHRQQNDSNKIWCQT